MGILYFSVIGAMALVVAELYGPRMYLMPSCLISRSANWAVRNGVDSSS